MPLAEGHVLFSSAAVQLDLLAGFSFSLQSEIETVGLFMDLSHR